MWLTQQQQQQTNKQPHYHGRGGALQIKSTASYFVKYITEAEKRHDDD
jgi:hypothetical protein